MATVSTSSGSTVNIPAFLDAEYVVPVLVLVFVALNVGNDEKYAALRGAIAALLQRPQQLLPEALGLLVVGLAVAAGLLLSPRGLHASKAELMSLQGEDEYNFELRRLWPTLLHADSLLIIQQMLMGLGVALLFIRGACARSNGSLALGLLVLAAAQGLRTQQWLEAENYTPEGPMGQQFAAGCACVTLALVLAAALRSARSACVSGCSAFRGTVNLILLLALCGWAAHANYLKASDSIRPDVTFSFIYMLELCAAPLLLAAACAAAEDVANLGGALVVFVLAQAAGVWWFLDFAAFLQDPNSSDPAVQHDLRIKNTLKTMENGHAYALFAASHAVRTLCAAGACGGYAVLRMSKPEPRPASGAPLLRIEPFVV